MPFCRSGAERGVAARRSRRAAERHSGVRVDLPAGRLVAGDHRARAVPAGVRRCRSPGRPRWQRGAGRPCRSRRRVPHGRLAALADAAARLAVDRPVRAPARRRREVLGAHGDRRAQSYAGLQCTQMISFRYVSSIAVVFTRVNR